MINEKRDFSKDAATWDENPGRLKMAESVFKTIESNLKLTKEMDVMDFGCGTGLLSLKIHPLVKSVTGVDSAEGMLKVLNDKITGSNLAGIKTLCIDLEKGEKLPGEYDVVTSSMTMHHIKNPAVLFEDFYNVIRPGGYLCIADLDPDDGMFHENNDGVFHMGFHRKEMKEFFNRAGFKEVNDFTAAEISKPGKDDTMYKFSVFLIIGKKI